MKSMTGYGLGKATSSATSIEVSVRAVNGRFLETRLHLPREFIPLESEIKKTLARYFERGTVDLFVSRKVKPGAVAHKVVVNKALASEYQAAYKTLAKHLKIKPSVMLESIARWPEVIKIDDSAELPLDESEAVLEAITKACQACDVERLREGKSLKADLEKCLKNLENEVEAIQTLREEANQNLQTRFEQKIKARLSGVEIDSGRLAQEVVIQLEKSDINEELTRLKEHMKNYGHLFTVGEPQGKKLDFYTQELLREVNTIGSKSSVSKLTHIVVQAKTLIERLREQVQNVE